MIPVEVRCALIKLACERPDEQDDEGKAKAPLRDIWTHEALKAALEAETDVSISSPRFDES